MQPISNSPLLDQPKTGRAAKARRRNISIALAIVVVLAIGITAVVAASGENKSGRSGAYVSGDPLAWTAVSAGNRTSCGLVNSGKVKCWGHNRFGQLGDRTNNDSNIPVEVSGITTATSISSGGAHTCALLTDSTIWCWGNNPYGQLGDETNISSNIPVQVSGITTATSISSVGTHTCALLTDSTIWCWGLGTDGQLGDGTANSSNIPVQVVGPTDSGDTTTSISSGAFHTCALLTDSTIWCWGQGTDGQLGDETNTNSNSPGQVSNIPADPDGPTASSIGSGSFHTCALLTDSTVWCWGRGTNGQLGDGTANSSNIPVQVSGIPTDSGDTATSISARFTHSCALLTDSTIWCWGQNTNGQLGNGTNDSSTTPVLVRNP